MGLSRRTRVAVLGVSLGLLSSCASAPDEGVVHTVRPGENLYRIALHYQVSVTEILAANEVPDPRDMPVGTRLWIPNARRGAPAGPLLADPARRRQAHDRARGRGQARAEALRAGTLRFAWPVRGRLTSRFGMRRSRPHEGIDLAAKRGTLVRSAEAGRVLHAGRLGGYGIAVILEHRHDHASVYAHLRRTRVRRGAFVDKGSVIGEVGATGNATGPHLHFEIREDERPIDPLPYLP